MNMNRLFTAVFIIMALFLVGYAYRTFNGSPPQEESATPGKAGFTAGQRVIADQIISVFENDTPEIRYGYAENLGDGRGITAGRAGFTSATADMLEVVERFTALEPENPLAAYLPRLRALAAHESGSTEGLEGLEQKWREMADHKLFRDMQDMIVDEYYYSAAVRHADNLGVTLPLTLLNLYDAAIQHGDGEDPDGLPAMIQATVDKVGGAPKDGIDEKLWLRAFMDTRRSILLAPSNGGTRDVWAQSAGRVDALRKIYDEGNFFLTGPIVVNPWGTSHIIPRPGTPDEAR